MKSKKATAIALVTSLTIGMSGYCYVSDKKQEIEHLKLVTNELVEEVNNLRYSLEGTSAELEHALKQVNDLTWSKNNLENELSKRDKLIKSQEATIQQQKKSIDDLKSRDVAVKSSRSKGQALISDKFELTWYSVGSKSANGKPLVDGTTCAITRNLIPKGSKVKIVLPDGTTYYRVADDVTGTAGDSHTEYGFLVDIYVDSKSKIPGYGRMKGVKVYLID